MKRVIICFTAIMLAIPLMISGCSNELEYISDGDFKYHYMEDKDSYAVIGTTEQGKGKDVLYFPAYYGEKLVTQMGFAREEGYMGVANHYWIGVNDITATKLYFPYTLEEGYYPNILIPEERSGQIYFANCNEQFLHSAVRLANHNMNTSYYVTPSAYNYIIDNVNDYGNVNKANVSFLFNYNNAPNEGYFFINNFDNGSIIKPTPYDPRRDGYAFDGWYKEPECVNIWDFDKDTLPEQKLDEEDREIYQETRLYAKWTTP